MTIKHFHEEASPTLVQAVELLINAILAEAIKSSAEKDTERVNTRILMINGYATLNSCYGILSQEFAKAIEGLIDNQSLKHGVIPE